MISRPTFAAENLTYPPVNEAWLKLLHYEDTWLGPRGMVTDSHFYLDPEEGPKNPAAELKAHFHAFETALYEKAGNLPEASNVACRFPARYAWFKTYASQWIQNWKAPSCPRFEKFAEALQGDSISLVFSSYYLNNPSSAYGHSFLRINKSAGADGQRFELLDYGINFAANVDTGNALVYAIKGVSGGFDGSFTSLPYYFKVREYNNAESRDLWEYELNLDSKVVSLFVAHVWEMGPMRIPYYYMSQNCSYWVLALVDAVRTEAKITDGLKHFVIPSDTIRLAWETPGLVRSFRFRPSIYREFETRRNKLSSAEQATVLQMAKSKNLQMKDEPPELQARMLDTLLDYLEFREPVDVQKPGTPESEFKNRILSARSRLPATEPLEIQPPEKEMPHVSHGSRRLMIGGKSTDRSDTSVLLGYRFALHDQLDPGQGYPSSAQIVMGDFEFSYSRLQAKAEFEKFDFFQVISASPYNRFEPSLSWRVRIGADRVEVLENQFCHRGSFSLGGGYTADLFGRLSATAGLIGAAAYSASCSQNFFTEAGPQVRIVQRWTPHLNSTLEGTWLVEARRQSPEQRRIEFGTQWSPTNSWGIRLQLMDKTFEKSSALNWVYYY